MTGIFITLEEAAACEGITYNTLVQRIRRNPGCYETQTQPAPEGGRPRVLVSVSTLSRRAQQAYKKAHPDSSIKEAIASEQAEGQPWYVAMHDKVNTSSREYLEALYMADQISAFVSLTSKERTIYVPHLAQKLQCSERTIYRYMDAVMEARAWALKKELETGHKYPIFEILALLRKPREILQPFPSLTPEVKAAIENIWFDVDFAKNKPSYELLYSMLKAWAKKAGWKSIPSCKTVGRYLNYLYDYRKAKQAHDLAENGTREFKNKNMAKCRRDTKALQVLEYVQGDAHTFDLWVQITDESGRKRAIRPKLAAWIDTRSRMILGDVICENPNAQILKESVVKMIYSPNGGAPKHLHIDNGKDFTAETNTGQSRKERKCTLDGEVKGFYRSMGIAEWSRALPYEPWGKAQMERVFGRICGQFSKQFKSYTGTLTGSKTSGKVPKDIQGMLERGELLTMEAFYEKWTEWKEEVYSKTMHRGLKDAGEKYVTPLEVFQNEERYEAIPYPYEYAAQQLMKAGTALVRNIGIQKFNSTFWNPELAQYIGETVNIRWDRRDVTRIYVYNKAADLVCVATSADLMRISPNMSQAALEEHIKTQKRQLRAARDTLKAFTTPYEERGEKPESTPDVVGGIDLTIKAKPDGKVVALPQDKEYRAELRRRAKAEKDAAKRVKAKRAAEGGRLLAVAGIGRDEAAAAANKISLRDRMIKAGDDLLKQSSYGK